MKKKAAFIIDKQHRDYVEGQFYEIYSDDVLTKLCDLLDIKVELIDINHLAEHQAELADVEFLFCWWGMSPVSVADIKAYLPRVRVLFYAGGRVDHFEAPFRACGIQIVSAIDVHAIPVAEFTVAEILLANKGAFLCREVLRSQDYPTARYHACQYEGNLYSRVGVLGVGNVGRKVIEYLKPFQVEVLACDPRLTPAQARQLGVELVSMEELFSNCNVITCHLQNSVATEKLITYEYFSMMGDHTTFINNGDGSHIVNEDLARALRENPTLTAMIDHSVPRQEDPAGLLKLPNVFRTPLIAGSMGNEVSRMGEYVYEQCRLMIEQEAGGKNVAV